MYSDSFITFGREVYIFSGYFITLARQINISSDYFITFDIDIRGEQVIVCDRN